MPTDAPDWTKTIIATAIVEGAEVTVEAAQAFWKGRTKRYVGTLLADTNSPQELDINHDMGKNAHDGYIANDVDVTLDIEISDDGDNYGDKNPIEKDEILDLFMLDIDKIRLTWTGNITYRMMVV